MRLSWSCNIRYNKEKCGCFCVWSRSWKLADVSLQRYVAMDPQAPALFINWGKLVYRLVAAVLQFRVPNTLWRSFIPALCKRIRRKCQKEPAHVWLRQKRKAPNRIGKKGLQQADQDCLFYSVTEFFASCGEVQVWICVNFVPEISNSPARHTSNFYSLVLWN